MVFKREANFDGDGVVEKKERKLCEKEGFYSLGYGSDWESQRDCHANSSATRDKPWHYGRSLEDVNFKKGGVFGVIGCLREAGNDLLSPSLCEACE